jgi:hypothetical protein
LLNWNVTGAPPGGVITEVMSFPGAPAALVKVEIQLTPAVTGLAPGAVVR